jgi:hypothetical protein
MENSSDQSSMGIVNIPNNGKLTIFANYFLNASCKEIDQLPKNLKKCRKLM